MTSREEDALLDVFGSDIEDNGTEEGGRAAHKARKKAKAAAAAAAASGSQSPSSAPDQQESAILPQAAPAADKPAAAEADADVAPREAPADAFAPPAPSSEPAVADEKDAAEERVEDDAPVPNRRLRKDSAEEAAAALPKRNAIMDSLDADDYEDEETIPRQKKRSRDSSDSIGETKRRKATSDDEDEIRRSRDDDAFIDDKDAVRHDSDDDDVIRTEGGMHTSKEPMEDDSPEDDEKPKKKLNAFEEALEKTKSFRRTRRRELDHSQVENECLVFLDRMSQARDDDMTCYKNGRPALNKLKMLREVETMITKVTHRDTLIENMLLPIIKAWLDPMPDGTLPNVQIRTTLLRILGTIRVDDNWVDRLKSSQGLGRVVHYLSKNDDHVPNVRMAEKLMMKWARPVYQSNANFQDLLAEYDRPSDRRGMQAAPDSIIAERQRARESARNFKSPRERLREFKGGASEPERVQIMAAIPKAAPFLYTALAEGKAEVDEKVRREHRTQAATSRKVNRTMNRMRQANKNRSARAAKPSVNGRG